MYYKILNNFNSYLDAVNFVVDFLLFPLRNKEDVDRRRAIEEEKKRIREAREKREREIEAEIQEEEDKAKSLYG